MKNAETRTRKRTLKSAMRCRPSRAPSRACLSPTGFGRAPRGAAMSASSARGSQVCCPVLTARSCSRARARDMSVRPYCPASPTVQPTLACAARASQVPQARRRLSRDNRQPAAAAGERCAAHQLLLVGPASFISPVVSAPLRPPLHAI